MRRRPFRTSRPLAALVALAVLGGGGVLRAADDGDVVAPATSGPCLPPTGAPVPDPGPDDTTTTTAPPTTVPPTTSTVPTTTTVPPTTTAGGPHITAVTLPPPPTTAPPTTTTPPTTTVPPTTVPPTTTTTVPALATVDLAFEEVAAVDAPSALASRAGSSLLYVTERAGRVRTIDPATGAVGEPLVDLADDLATDGERGLLGLAFSADGTRLYLSFNPADGDSRVDEWTMDGDTIVATSRRTVITVAQPATANHKGGDVAIGPDGMLWWALGDGGGQGDPYGNGQNLDTLLAGVIRVDPTGCDADGYRIPADNPWADGGARPEKWLSGLRNPWRFAFDRTTGDLWIADVGQDRWEEIDLLPAPARGAGANLGWPRREGTHVLDGDLTAAHVDPIFEYEHGATTGCSISGGQVYRGDAIPELRGTYLYSDFCASTLRGVRPDAAGVDAHDFGAHLRGNGIVGFGEGPDGELYAYSIFSGAIGRIVRAPIAP